MFQGGYGLLVLFLEGPYEYQKKKLKGLLNDGTSETSRDNWRKRRNEGGGDGRLFREGKYSIVMRKACLRSTTCPISLRIDENKT